MAAVNTAGPQPSIDVRALGPGTGARFAVLVVVMLVAATWFSGI
ncbi:hypothetical protein [Streptomyces sp. NPDC058385]